MAQAQISLPATVLAAYQHAERQMREERSACHLSWPVLAGIGQVESGQARGGAVTADGTTTSPILGPVLDGNGFAAVTDTDGGRLDGSARWDRAVGPMQFIPSTWAHWGADGNGDAHADPSNVFDAALATGRYLCANGRDLADPVDLDHAILSYNHSTDYLVTVRAWIRSYSHGRAASTPPSSPVTILAGGSVPQAVAEPATPASTASVANPSRGHVPAHGESASAARPPQPAHAATPDANPGRPPATALPSLPDVVFPCPTQTASAVPSATESPTATPEPSASPDGQPSATPSPTPTLTPAQSPPAATLSPSPAESVSPSVTATASTPAPSPSTSPGAAEGFCAVPPLDVLPTR